jgi:LuxR family maltose regulon positive regulatory protein
MFLGNTARAWECLDGAAQKAVPDGLLYLIAVYNWMLQGLPEKLFQKQYPEQLGRFLEIKERFLAGFLMLHNSLAANDMPGTLTAREREVALLAAQGLRNSEIASKLMVSENTVRSHLRSVFQKLDIDRRAKLAEKLK